MLTRRLCFLGLASLASVLATENASAQYWHTMPAISEVAPGTASFSNDEKRIFFISKEGGVANVWSAPVGGGAAQQVTKFTDDGVTRFVHLLGQPVVLFMRAAGATKEPHIYRVKDDGTGDIQDLTPGGDGVTNTIIGESYNGRYVYFTSNKINHDKVDAYRYDTQQLKSELIFANDRDFEVLGWTRDTKNLLLQDPHSGELSLFEVASSDRTPVAKPSGGAYGHAVLDPMSRNLLVLGADERKVLDLGTKAWTSVKDATASPWKDVADAAIAWVDYSANGKFVTARTKSGAWSVKEAANGAEVALPAGVMPVAIAPRETLIAYTTAPAADGARKLYVYNTDKKAATEIATLK